jgi:hypothetical protein
MGELGGTIRVLSKGLHKGATFTISIPLTSAMSGENEVQNLSSPELANV